MNVWSIFKSKLATALLALALCATDAAAMRPAAAAAAASTAATSMTPSSSSSTVTAASTNTTHADTMPIAATVEMKQEARTASATPSATADDETKGITQLVVRKPGTGEGTLFRLLYDELDPMPPELIAIIVEYDDYELKGECAQILNGHTYAVTCVIQLTNDLHKDHIASGSMDGTIKIWAPKTGACVKTLTCPTNYPDNLIQLADGRLASDSWNDAIRVCRVWDLESGKCVKTTNQTGSVRYLIQLTDGRLAFALNDCTTKIWNPETGYILTLTGHENWVTCVIQLADSRLASGSWDSTIKIWDLASGKCVKTITQTGSVSCLTQLTNGYLASGSPKGIIKVWDLESGECILTLDHTDWVTCLTQLSNGYLVSGSVDGKIKVWK